MFPRRLVVTFCAAVTGLASIASPQSPQVGVIVGDSARMTVAPSTKITVPVYVNPSGGANLASLASGLTWSPAILTLDSIKPGAFGTLTPNTTQASSGSASFALTSATGATAKSSIALLYFTAPATSGGTRVAAEPTAAADAAGTSMLSQLVLTPLSVCVAPQGRWGDVNDDGNVNIIDAQQIARYSVSLSVANLTAVQTRGDVTADGTVNIIDAQQIARFSVQLSAAARINTVMAVTQTIASVVMTPTTANVVVGATTTLYAEPRDANGVPLVGCAAVSWTSSDTTKARVSSDGVVTGIAAGTATITAASGGQSTTATVTVIAGGGAVPASLQIVDGDQQVSIVGYIFRIRPSVRVLDAQGRVVPNVPVTFTVLTTGYLATPAGTGVPSARENSDAAGIATSPLYWYPNAGATHTLQASTPGIAPVTFTGTALSSTSLRTQCALTTDGTPYCWGEYERDILNAGSTDPMLGAKPVQVSSSVKLASLSPTVGTHACGLTSAGAAWCWGYNNAGQLGDGTTTMSALAQVSGGRSFTKISAGQHHTCALTSTGAAYCWGLDNAGQLGAGTLGRISTTPVAVSGGLSFVEISAGLLNTCAVTSGGDAYCWGDALLIDSTSGSYPAPRKITGLPTVTQVALASTSACALSTNGSAHCWGANSNGQLGDGTFVARYASKLPASGAAFTRILGSPNGLWFCGITTDGGTSCWGLNAQGQLGNGDDAHNPRLVPTPIALPAPVTNLTMHEYGGCARAPNGMPWCWGLTAIGDGAPSIATVSRLSPVPVLWVEGTAGVAANVAIRAGHGQYVPVGTAVPVAPSVAVTDYRGTAVSGATVTFAVVDGGGSITGATAMTDNAGVATVGSWTLGPTSGTHHLSASVSGAPMAMFTATAYAAPASLTLLSGDQQAAPLTGIDFPGALMVQLKDASGNPARNVPVVFTLTAGSAALYGGSPQTVYSDSSGVAQVQMASGDTSGSAITVTAQSGTLTPVTFSARTVAYTMADARCELTSAGAAFCWGFNGRGQVGDGTTTYRTVPTAVSGGLAFASIYDGGVHVCALTSAGAAYCWGSNAYGELGDGSLTDRTTPVAVTGGLAFARLSVGPTSTCGLTSAGALYCWGWASFGFFGDSVLGVARTAPTRVNTLGFNVVSVAVGMYHMCAAATTGTVYCWGRNNFGQIGDGTLTNRVVPTALPDGRTYTEVAVGVNHSCARATSGAAYCWGANVYGQVGNGTVATQGATPTAVQGGIAFASISASYYSTCGLASGSSIAWCWGRNTYGMNGDGTTNNAQVPVPVAGGIRFTDVRPRYYTTCGRATNGHPYCWGNGASGRLGNGASNSIAVPEPVSWVEGAPGTAASMVPVGALSLTGAAGVPIMTSPQVKVREYAGAAVAGFTVNWSVVAGGGSLAGVTSLTDANGIATSPAWTLGASVGVVNTLTASAPGLPTPSFTATSTLAPANLTVAGGDQQIGAVSSAFAAPLQVLVKDGSNAPIANAPVQFTVTGGGATISGATSATATSDFSGIAQVTLTAGSTPTSAINVTAQTQGPAAVTFTARAVASTVGESRCELITAGAAYCWGVNNRGQVGDGTTTTRLQPTAVAGGMTFRSVYDGGEHVCALTAAGAAYCWGSNNYGELGDGTITDRLQPVAVTGSVVFSSLSISPASSCGLTAAGALYCWGWTGYGFGGDSVLGKERTAPVLVNTGGLAFTRIALSRNHICGVTTSGSLACWGLNNYYQLGNGTTINRTSPTLLTDGRVYADVAVGDYHACGLTTAGAAYCWGYSSDGQLGNGSMGSIYPSPSTVSGALTFASIVAHRYSTCGIVTSSGTVWCWGYNGSGQLGDGSVTSRSTPVPVAGGISFVSLRIRYATTCSRATNGQPYCWGLGTTGQIGNGASTSLRVPEPVKWVEGAAGVATSMVVNGSSTLSGTAGLPLVTSPQVKVRDYASNAVAGFTVTWTVTSGGGSLASASSTTDAGGIATSPAWTLGALVGGTNTLTASATSLPSQIFTVTVTPNTASGTFTWNSGTGTLTSIWTISNFKCGGGPEVGTETMTGVTITSTTMTFTYGNDMTFTRSGGTAGDIIGKWTGTDITTGNTYSLTFNTDSSVTLVVNMVVSPCFEALAQHWQHDGVYRVFLAYIDPNKSATQVSVTGPGISGAKVLTYETNSGKWNSTSPSTPVNFGTSYPALPLTYTFSVTDATGTWTTTHKVPCFQEPFVANLLPTGNVSGTINFSWTGINDPNALYQVQLNDNNNNRLWDSPKTYGTSMTYDGASLTSGATYRYTVVITKSSSCDSESFVQESFIYTP